LIIRQNHKESKCRVATEQKTSPASLLRLVVLGTSQPLAVFSRPGLIHLLAKVENLKGGVFIPLQDEHQRNPNARSSEKNGGVESPSDIGLPFANFKSATQKI